MHTVIISSNQYYMLKCMDKKPEDFCMTYKIIGDSCLDLTDELKKDPRFQMIPEEIYRFGKGLPGMPEDGMPFTGDI